MPFFEPAFQPQPSIPLQLVPPSPAPAPAKTVTSPPRPWPWLWIQFVIIVVLVGACLWMWHERAAAVQLNAPVASSSSLWPLLFNKEHQTSIICADSSLVVAQNLVHHSILLDQYLNRNYTGSVKVSAETAVLLERLQRWPYTNISDTRLVQRLSEVNAGRWGNTSVRSARTAQIQDFKNGNAILLGSVRSNPWNSLFEQQLNFRFERDEATGTTFVRNKMPLSREDRLYRSAHPGESGEEYSVVALVPNLRGTGNVLIIAGATGESTEAAGEFLLNPETWSRLLLQLGTPQGGKLPYFEVLLRSSTVADVARRASVVAIRVLPGRMETT